MKKPAMALCAVITMFLLAGVGAAQIAPSSDLEQALVAEINLLRSDPPGYAKFLRSRLSYFSGNSYGDPLTKDRITTKEGAAAVSEAIKVLEKLSPLKTYSFSKDLTAIARLQSSDLSKTGLCGHRGSDGSTTETRFRRFGDSPEISEIVFCHLREKTPPTPREMAREIVIGWLIDDGVPTRGHRVRLISPTLRQIGVAPEGTGKRMRVVVVMADAFNASKPGFKSF